MTFPAFRRLGGIKRLFSFAVFSGIGVVTDWLILFALTEWTSVPDWLANIISSGVGTTIVYLLVTRRTWGVRQSWTTYLVFVAWYALVILLCSGFIQWMHTANGLEAIWGKAITVPFSFGANYVFNRILFSSSFVRRAQAIDPVPAVSDSAEEPIR